MSGETSFEVMKGRFSYALALYTAESEEPAMRPFRAVQYLTYGLLFVFLILAVGEKAAWQEVIRAPGLASILNLTISFIHTLFGTKGLVAMGSFALLNLFFGFRFFRAYERRLEKEAMKRTTLLHKVLGEIWQGTLDDLHRAIERLREDTKTQKETLSKLLDKPS